MNKGIFYGGDGEQESTLHSYPHSVDISKRNNNISGQVQNFNSTPSKKNSLNRTSTDSTHFTTFRSLES